MPADYRYVKNEALYLTVAQSAVSSQFASDTEFKRFYQEIGRRERRNLFLRAAAFYYYLVKHGDWIVTATDCDPVIDYLTNSYKTVGIFALIESLSDEEHEDFHAWLSKDENASFPIAAREQLNELHKKYKATYGSIRRCVGFFARLSPEMQAQLCQSVEVDNKPMPNIKKLAEFLYNTRSKFVHEAAVVLQMSGASAHQGDKKLINTKLTMSTVFSAFEEGLVAYFRET